MKGIIYSIDRFVSFKDYEGIMRTGRIIRFIHTLNSVNVTDKDYLVYAIQALDDVEGYTTYKVLGKDIIGYVKNEDFMKEIEENYCGGFTYLSDAVKKSFSQKPFKVGKNKFDYDKIIFNGPATIIIWKDGSKTIAKASEDEFDFDPEKGVAICFMKKMLGHTETNKILRNAHKQYEKDTNKKILEIPFTPLTFNPKDLHPLKPEEYRLYFDGHTEHVTEMNKVEEEDNHVD